MSEELAVPENHAPARIVGGIPYFAEYMQLAQAVSKTAMVPSAMRNKPDEVLAVVMYGAELGIGPMQALQQINFISGKPSAAAELLRALVMEAGHKFILTSTRTVATAKCKRKDWDDYEETTFTMEDAKLAGLGSGDGWKKYPDQMLGARVTSKACRMWFADVIAGMSYTPEEVMAFSAPETTAPTRTRRATTPATVERSAPVIEGETLATEDEVETLHTALGMLDADEKESIKPAWLAQNFPKKLGDMTSEQVDVALGIVSGVLNAVSTDVVDAEIVESEPERAQVVDPTAATQPQIAKIRIMLTNAGVDKDVIHQHVSDLIGREVTSLKALTKAEAHQIIDGMEVAQ
jgi:hypothetical protein